ncbi:MAG: hypothetical protein M3N32_00800 [Actinomycetota bacterium]|nr:hypothetical protein [Actinomycetota bacterium]
MQPDRRGQEVFQHPMLPIRVTPRAGAGSGNMTGRRWPTPSCLDLAEVTRDGLVAGAIAGVVSGAPSTLWALATGGDPLEAARAAGSILAPNAGPLGLYSAAAVVHSGLSLGWGVVLAWLLPRRRPVLMGALAGVAIATLDLGIVGRHIPRVRALPPGPQVADHLLYGVTVAAVLSRRQRLRASLVDGGGPRSADGHVFASFSREGSS